VQSINAFIMRPPVEPMSWERLAALAAFTGAITAMFETHRLLSVDRPRLERLALAWGGVQLVLLFAVPASLYLDATFWIVIPSHVLGFYVLLLFLRYGARLPRYQWALFLALIVWLVAEPFHAYATRGSVTEPPTAMATGGPLLFLFLGVVLTDRFIRTLRRAERHNEELEERVAEKHRELEVQFDRLHELERERVLAAERERMMLEIHDGLGGRLVETLSIVEGGQATREVVSAGLRGSLDEMRMLIDSLDPLAGDLPTLLAIVRERHEAAVIRQGVRLEWDVKDLPTPPSFGPRESLHLLRVVQEALTNALKHAGATRVRISARPERRGDADGVQIEVCDDGRGIAGERPGGRGLRNMQRRSEMLGGRLTIRGDDEGTTVGLWLPL
jgi:signal transduction histidine kinase